MKRKITKKMKTIKLSSISPGTITDSVYFTEDGKVLFAEGVTITQRHIDLLKRRNIFNVYIKTGTDEIDEIERLLATEFENLGELDIIEKKDSGKKLKRDLVLRPRVLEMPQFKRIKPGLEGVKQLNKSKTASDLDKKYKSGLATDRPVGSGLKLKVKAMRPEDRNDAYKADATSSYDAALKKVKKILNGIVNGQNISSDQIQRVVKSFVKKFITDKNILLNLSTIRSDETIYIYSHVLNVCLLSINIAAASGYSEDQVVEIGTGALLYDVGMLLVPPEIYLKKGRLTKDEWYEVHKHPILGLHLLENIKKLPESIKFIAYQSHEREDASGYPKGRNKRLIHRFSKIIKIADIFVAISSRRSYRDESLPYKAMETILKMVKQGHVSREFVKAFLSYISLFPVGSLVELNDHRIAKVINANESVFDKPEVSVLTDPKGNILSKEDIFQVNLSLDSDIHIINVLSSDKLPEIALMDGF